MTWKVKRMPRFSLFAAEICLIGFSTLAFAGPGDPTSVGSAPSRPTSAGGLESALSISTAPGAGGATPSASGSLVLNAPTNVDATPVLKHIASTGAQLLELGDAHGLRSVSARSGEQFMILQITPDGEAVVGGPQLDLPVDKLMTLASGQVKELGETHGLRGLYLRNGSEFQVLYATPDGKATIAGVMWDATGKNLTRDQVSKIDGAIPTVFVKDGAKSAEAAATTDAFASVEHASFGLTGDPAAPRLWMIVDPYCSYSVRAFDALRPYVKAGRIQLAVVPISILDYEDNGQSTPAAQSLLSQKADQMVDAWDHQNFRLAPSENASALLTKNNRLAEDIGLRGTPTLIWRKADGSAGEIDGIPTNWDALISQVEEAQSVSR
jgi:thiol:disulfide interchange protein DsbG